MTRPGDDVWWRRSGSTACGLKPDPWFSLPRERICFAWTRRRSPMVCENSNAEQGPAHQSRHRDQPDGATNRKCTESVETVRNHSCGAHPGSAGFPGRTSRRACSSSIARRGLLTSRTGDTGGLGDRRELAPPPGPGSGSEDQEQRRVTGSLPARRETAGVCSRVPIRITRRCCAPTRGRAAFPPSTTAPRGVPARHGRVVPGHPVVDKIANVLTSGDREPSSIPVPALRSRRRTATGDDDG